MITIEKITLTAKCRRCDREEKVELLLDYSISGPGHRFSLDYSEATRLYQDENSDMILENNNDYPDTWICFSCNEKEEAQNSIPTLQSLNPSLR